MSTARKTPMALLAALGFLTLALAGCSGKLGADDVSGPIADLQTSTREPFRGEPVTFDGQDSNAPGDAEIVLWRFDFGDGTVLEVDNEDEARLQHTYAQPGVYTVTLTVESQEDDDERERDSTSTSIGVGDRVPVEAAVVKDPLNTQAASNMTLDVTTKEDASSYDVNVTVTGTTGFGSSRITLTLIDPTGAEMDSKDVTVDAGQDQVVSMEGMLTRTGNYQLKMEATSGAADITGMVEIRYDPDVPN